MLLKPQRQAALKISRCYSSVSKQAALVLAGTPPADLLVDEWARIQKRSTEESSTPKAKIKAEERCVNINEWGRMCRMDNGKAAWTRRLLPDMA